MRQVVMSDDYREAEVWPPTAFNKYLDMTRREVKRLLIDKGSLTDIPCPACNGDRRGSAFKKFGLQYVECMDCNTLYITPRPSEEAINRYFINSRAIEFWYSHVVKESLKARVGHLFRPRALWVANVTGETFASPRMFVDVGSMYSEFLEEIDSLNLFQTKIALDPLVDISGTLKKGIELVNKPVMKLAPGEINADVVTAIAVIDRVFNPESFLKKIRTILVDNGLLFFTTSTISGFDLQVLWENSKTIFPPDHMNLLSIEGIIRLLGRCGFEAIELSTPGQLDVEVVKNALRSNDKLKVPRFLSYLLNKRDEDAHHSFQEFLQRFQMSSHVRVAARKK
jgi:hypothetical protein